PGNMVCFTSLTIWWRKMVAKREDACNVLMPLWELDKLIDATKYLKLDITEEMIRKRLVIFGGVVRQCLQQTKVLFRTQLIGFVLTSITWIHWRNCVDWLEDFVDLQVLECVTVSQSPRSVDLSMLILHQSLFLAWYWRS
ncbi:hypothetical protein PHMEG_00037174, partial [Phytophthora megakarya]